MIGEKNLALISQITYVEQQRNQHDFHNFMEWKAILLNQKHVMF